MAAKIFTASFCIGAMEPTPFALDGEVQVRTRMRMTLVCDHRILYGADAAEFAVGIRSGLVRGNRLALFSGAGIVEGSVPEAEWAEIEQKISDFTGMFGFDPARSAAR